MKTIFLIFITVIISYSVYSQELNCMIQVTHDQIQGTNIEVYNSMQKSLYEFMNNMKWTEHKFSMDERIECTFMITISRQIGTERFIGTIQVQARRPVFNTTYYTTLFNFQEKKEDFQFEYIEQQPLTFNENAHTSNLTSVLAFYSYLILGLDYDTFSDNGGAEFFQKAQKIVNNAQSAAEPGWKSYESTKMNNRYWLIENMTNSSYSDLHKFAYKYHRLGFDVLSEKIDQGRGEVAKSLELLRGVYRKKPNLYFLQLIINSKSEEIIKLFAESFPREQSDVFNIMVEIDPANASKYEAIKNKTE